MYRILYPKKKKIYVPNFSLRWVPMSFMTSLYYHFVVEFHSISSIFLKIYYFTLYIPPHDGHQLFFLFLYWKPKKLVLDSGLLLLQWGRGPTNIPIGNRARMISYTAIHLRRDILIVIILFKKNYRSHIIYIYSLFKYQFRIDASTLL
jgi:hypothetical protein